MKIGEKKNRLILLKIIGKDKYYNKIGLFKCDCGNEIQTTIIHVKREHTKSCGCLQKENLKKLVTTHNKSKNGKYKCWAAMKTRCYNKNYWGYKYYGAKGIKICDKWLTFEGFDEDMPEYPGKGYSIERKDNNKDYCKENCIWLYKSEQNKNKSTNRKIEYNNQIKNLSEWSKILKFPVKILWDRLNEGWTIEEAFTTPINYPRIHNLITYNNQTLSLHEWSNKTGINYNVLKNRRSSGWSVEKMLTTPINKNMARNKK